MTKPFRLFNLAKKINFGSLNEHSDDDCVTPKKNVDSLSGELVKVQNISNFDDFKQVLDEVKNVFISNNYTLF